MLQNLLEKLQLNNEKNLLIQGLPSSIETQFFRLTFAKNVTPLLKSKKIYSLLVAVAVDDGKVERGAKTKRGAWMTGVHVLENPGPVK